MSSDTSEMKSFLTKELQKNYRDYLLSYIARLDQKKLVKFFNIETLKNQLNEAIINPLSFEPYYLLRNLLKEIMKHKEHELVMLLMLDSLRNV